MFCDVHYIIFSNYLQSFISEILIRNMSKQYKSTPAKETLLAY